MNTANAFVLKLHARVVVTSLCNRAFSAPRFAMAVPSYAPLQCALQQSKRQCGDSAAPSGLIPVQLPVSRRLASQPALCLLTMTDRPVQRPARDVRMSQYTLKHLCGKTVKLCEVEPQATLSWRMSLVSRASEVEECTETP